MVFLPLSQGKVAIIDKVDDVGIRWYCGMNGYAEYKSRTQRMYLHRWVMERKLKRTLLSSEHVEHKNGVPLDCRRVNLRLCTPTLNAANAKIRADNKTGAKGVSLDKRNGHYTAQFYIKGRKYHLGSFKTLKEASAARRAKELELYGEFALRKRKIHNLDVTKGAIMGFPDFGKKNKGGKADKPTALKTPKDAVKRLKRKKPEQC